MVMRVDLVVSVLEKTRAARFLGCSLTLPRRPMGEGLLSPFHETTRDYYQGDDVKSHRVLLLVRARAMMLRVVVRLRRKWDTQREACAYSQVSFHEEHNKRGSLHFTDCTASRDPPRVVRST